MKIRLLSDIHNEFHGTRVLMADGTQFGKGVQDVVVLAGDIDSGASAVRYGQRHFPDVPVVLVPGNHEYYGRHLGTTILEMIEAARGTNVHVLEYDELVIDGVRFLGTTLWTDFELFKGPENRAYALAMAKRQIADFQRIRAGAPSGLFTPEQSVLLHREAVSWLEWKLQTEFSGPTVVVTHHAPHRGSLAKRWETDILSPAFVSDLDRLMGPPIDLWLHGHTHTAFDYNVRGTRVACNPYGYPRERVAGFDPSLIIEI